MLDYFSSCLAMLGEVRLGDKNLGQFKSG